VQDAYRWGTVDVLDLLDAQNAALVADQVAANAVYDFLVDYMNIERAMGRFELMLGTQERAQLLDELERFMAGTSDEG
jgi:outer membrane protein TolC